MPLRPYLRSLTKIATLTLLLTTIASGEQRLCAADAAPRRPLVVAHRGASHDAPENTLSAFRLAWDRGADCIEGDFYLSKDGQIVCIHDKTTKRTSGVEVNVAETTLAELKQLDVGAWKDPQWKGERIPTIQEVFATVPPDKTILIEIKCGPEIVPTLKQVIETSKLKPAQMIIIAFNKDVVAATKKQLPQLKAFWLTGYKKNELGIYKPSRNSVLTTLKQIGADGLDTQANLDVVNEQFVGKLRAAGMEFHVWTVDDPKVAAHFLALGVDSFTTNRPGFIRHWLRETQLKKGRRKQ